MTEGGWDRPHDRARSLGERDGNDEGNEDDDNVVSRLDMYRTKVLLYRTIVLLARPTKVIR